MDLFVFFCAFGFGFSDFFFIRNAFRLAFFLRTDKHQHERNQQEQTRKPNRFIRKNGGKEVSQSCAARKNDDYDKVNQRAFQQAFFVRGDKTVYGLRSAAYIAYAHRACKGIAFDFLKRMDLHCANERNERVCKHIKRLRQKSDRKKY